MLDTSHKKAEQSAFKIRVMTIYRDSGLQLIGVFFQYLQVGTLASKIHSVLEY